MGCTDFELDLSMAPGHARRLGEAIGECQDVNYVVDDYGLKISDDNHSFLPLDKYFDKFQDLGGVKTPELKGVARENFVAGFVGAVIARNMNNGESGQ